MPSWIIYGCYFLARTEIVPPMMTVEEEMFSKAVCYRAEDLFLDLFGNLDSGLI